METKLYKGHNISIKIILIILLSIFLSSCKSYVLLSVETLEPPVTPLVGEKKVGFLDRNIRLHSNITHKLYDSDAIQPDELAYLFYSSLEQTLKNENILDTIYPIAGTERIFVSDLAFPDEIDASELSEIYDVYDINYLISLENCGYYNDTQRATSGKFYCLRVYAKDSTEALSRNLIRYDMSTALANSYKNMLNNELYVEKLVREYAEIAGARYASIFIPDWKYTERRVYNRGQVLKFGYDFFKNNDFDRAVQLWEGGLRLKPTKGIQAAINLAWLYEDRGEFDKSIEYLNKGKEIAKTHDIKNNTTEYLDSYYNLLIKRKENIKKIGFE